MLVPTDPGGSESVLEYAQPTSPPGNLDIEEQLQRTAELAKVTNKAMTKDERQLLSHALNLFLIRQNLNEAVTAIEYVESKAEHACPTTPVHQLCSSITRLLITTTTILDKELSSTDEALKRIAEQVEQARQVPTAISDRCAYPTCDNTRLENSQYCKLHQFPGQQKDGE